MKNETTHGKPRRAAMTVLPRIRAGAKYGGVIGIALVAVGVARAAIAALLGMDLGISPGRDVVALLVYVAAFTLAGAVTGGLWPLRRSWPGAIVVGYLAGFIVCAASGLIVMELVQSRDRGVYLSMVEIMTAIFGTVAVIMVHESGKDGPSRQRPNER